MAQNMFGSALNPQNVVPLDINTSTSYAANFLPPYQNVSSGTYLLQNINPLSDTVLQTTDRGNLNTLYYSFSTASQVLIGTPSSFVLQTKNDFNYFPLATRYSPWTTSATVFAVAWNGIIFVAGGGSSTGTGLSYTLATSTDGFAWVPRDSGQVFGFDPYNATTAGIVYGLAWNGLIWVAVGQSGSGSNPAGNVVATSPDGIVWTGRGSFLISTQSGNTQGKVAVAAFLLPNNTVAPQSNSVTLIGQTGNSYNFYYSTTDGINLTRYQFAPGINGFWNAAWNGVIWIAVTGVINGNAYTSVDGLNWTTRSVPNATGLYGVAWSPNLSIWVVCGSTATNNANIQYSFDAITWTNAGPTNTTTFFDVQWVSAPAFLGGAPQNVFVAVGASTSIFYTTTIGTFVNTSVTTTALGTLQLNTVVFCPTIGLWLVGGVGNGTASVGYVPAVTSGSTPYAGTWIVAGNALATMTNVTEFAWSQSLGVLVASGNGVNSIMVTTTGLAWTGIGGASAAASLSTFSTGSTGVAFNPVSNLFIATGTGINTFISSTDGFNWTPFGTTGVDLIGYGITWSPLLNQWIMVGQGQHSIATSTNAINWVGRTGTQIFSGQGNAVTWAPGLNTYVAVGQGGNVLATSTNGINWVSRIAAGGSLISSAGLCVAFNGTIVVVGGTGGSIIATSPDTVNWTGRTSGGITTSVFSIAYSPLLNQWVAGGNGGVIAVAYGATITGTAPSSFSSTGTTSGLGASGGNVRALTWNPVSNLYVLGANTITTGASPLSTSNDGLFFANLQPLINILFSVYCVAYNGSLWCAGGSGASNTIAASIDGINWTGQGASVFTGTGGACYGIAWNGWTNVGGAQPWIPIAAPGTTTNSFTWIAVGATSGGAGVMAFSTVGTTPYASTITMSWSSISQSIITTAIYGIVWYPFTSVWVAVGTGTNTIGYTLVPSGQSGWTAAAGTQISGSITNNPPLPNGAITSAATGRAVAYGFVNGAGIIVAVGAGGTNCYAYSVNGVTWVGNGTGNFLGTGSAGVPITSPAVQLMQCGNGIAWSPSTYTFVVTGFGTAAGAQSATNYTTQNTIISSANPATVTAWVAANNATIQSTVTISSATTVYGSVFGGAGSATGQGNGVIWNGSMFVAVGQGPMSTGFVKANIGLPPPSTVLSTLSSLSTVVPNAISGTSVPYVVEATSLDGVNWRPAPLAPSQQQYMAVASRYPIMVCGGASTGLGTNNFLGYSIDNALSWVPLNRTTTLGSSGTAAGITTNIFCVAFNGIIWLAGGAVGATSGSTYIISKDGITWTPPTYAGLYPGAGTSSGSAIYGVAWANSLALWCVVGLTGASTNPTIATSPDGVTWTARGGVGTAGIFFAAATTSTASAVAWNGTFFVVVGNNGGASPGAGSTSVVYSRDGISWAIAATNNIVPCSPISVNNAASIAWNGNVWVLVTTGAANNNANVIYWSSTTFSWNSIVAATGLGGAYTFPSLNTFTFLGVARSVAWNGSLFLVTGGFSGSAAGTPVGAPQTYGYYIATSPDGFNWTSRNMTLVGSGSITTGASVGGGWLSAQTSFIAPYALTTNGTTGGTPSLTLNTVVWHPISRQWVIGVTDQTLASATSSYAGIVTLVSTDTINWSISMNHGFNNNSPIKALVWSPTQNYWVMVGSAVPSGTGTGYAQATGSASVAGYLTVATSTDGFQIVPRQFYNATNNPLGAFNAVAFFNGNYLAGGAVGSTLIATTGYYGIYASTDGVTWTSYLITQGAANAAPTVIYGIAYAVDRWYVVGTCGTTNGYIGTGQINNNIVGLTQSNNFNGNRPVYSVAFGNGFVVGVGATGGTSGGAMQFQISNTTWSNASTLGFTTAAYAVVYAAFTRATPIWIAGGAGTIAISTSPAAGPGTWTTQASATSLFTAVYGLAANTNIAVAVGTGTNTIAYSYDGVTWVGVPNSQSSAIFTNGYCVAWNGSMFVAGGDNNVQATSPDGVNWTPRRVFAPSLAAAAGFGCFALGFQTREKTLTVNNAQWTGRTSQQNFRIIG